jgi:hypothetical protein
MTSFDNTKEPCPGVQETSAPFAETAAKVVPLHGPAAAELVEARAILAWLQSPEFPQAPPRSIADALSRERASRVAEGAF